jgi:hypothetical protein
LARIRADFGTKQRRSGQFDMLHRNFVGDLRVDVRGQRSTGTREEKLMSQNPNQQNDPRPGQQQGGGGQQKPGQHQQGGGGQQKPGQQQQGGQQKPGQQSQEPGRGGQQGGMNR